MAYDEQTWVDDEAGGTPLSAARLNHIEAGITAHETDSLGAHAASAISVLDAGGLLTATDGEAALAELAARVGVDGSAVTTSHDYLLAHAPRPLCLTVAASDSPYGTSHADYVCDGTADEVQFQAACDLLSAAGGGIVSLSPGTFVLAAAVAVPSKVSIVGSGKQSTVIARSADTIAFDVSGGDIATHVSRVRIADMKFYGAYSAGVAYPAVRLFYADHIDIERCDFIGMRSAGIEGLEWWDSVVYRCRFDQCGTQGVGPRVFAATPDGAGLGTGGNPAIMLHGDTETAGFGHTTNNCNSLHFNECWGESLPDGWMQIHGNSTAENFVGQLQCHANKIYIRGCKLESGAGYSGWAPTIGVRFADVMFLDDLDLCIGTGFAGWSAQDVLSFRECSEVHIGHVHVETQGANASVRTFIYFWYCYASGWDRITCSLSGSANPNPTRGVVEWYGNCTKMWRGTVIDYYDAGTDETMFVGEPISEMETFGTATIASGATSIAVNHRLPRAPVDGEVMVTMTNNPTVDPGNFYVGNYTSSQFTIYVRTNPSTSGATFAWSARVSNSQT